MRLLALAAALALAAGAAGTASPSPRGLGPNVTNPWFPLVPGSTLVYRGVRDGKPARDVVTVLRRTAVVDGVRCRAVRDLLYLSGRLTERTTDWYAQGRSGTVWYMGEATAELDRHGKVTSREGSWRSGEHGARAGVFMPGTPRPGQRFRQEYRRGSAEDHFEVLGLHASVSVPYVSVHGKALLTKEWTPLEPGVIDHKLYLRGVGVVKEQTVRGGDERLELVSARGLRRR
jgi:hypothetical protein